MNNDPQPQLIIFEPLKEPRTVTLNVIEDINAASPVIYDENGHEVTNYKVLYDESRPTVDPIKQEILAYIENWESQGNVVDEKQARKIAKRKRTQAAKKLKKQRNKKRKAAMKSLIHCNFDTSSLANPDVEEERAILRAMKTQKHKIKNVLNIKPNPIINCNTNVRPLENSTIEFGSKKKPIDVVVLDSDEESDSDSDDVQINIVTPQPIPTRRRRTANASANITLRTQNTSVSLVPTARKRRKKKIDIVQIVDSSDSDVECISNEEFIQSLSDDDDHVNDASTSKKKRININLEDKLLPGSEELDCVPVDDEASEELVSMVDNFFNKYIQPVIVPLTEVTSQTDSEFPAAQILITEPISLQPNPTPESVELQKSPETSPQIVITESISLQRNPAPALVELEKSTESGSQIVIKESVSLQPNPPPVSIELGQSPKTSSQIMMTESVSLQTRPPPVPIKSRKSPKTSSQIRITESVSLQTKPPPVPIKSRKSPKSSSQILITESVSLQPDLPPTQSESKKKKVDFVNDDELIIVENDPINDSIQTDSRKSNSAHEAEIENLSDNSDKFEPISEDEDGDDDDDDDRNKKVLEFDSIPSPDYTPTNSFLKTASAFADFLRNQKVQDSIKVDEPEYNSPVEIEESDSALTSKSSQKSNTTCQTVSKCNPSSPKKRCHPWQKRGSDESDEILIDKHLHTNPIQNIRPWQKPCDSKNDEIEVLEDPVKESQHCKPWQKRNYDKSDEIQVVERPTTIRQQSPCFQKKTPVSVITRPEQPSKPNFNREHSFPNQNFQRRPFQQTTSSPNINNISDCSNRPSAFNRLDNTNSTPARRPFCPNNRRPVFDRLGDFQRDPPKPSSPVEFVDKKFNHFDESRNKSEKVDRDKDYFEQGCYNEPADYSRRESCTKNFFNDRRNDLSYEPRQNQNNWQRRKFDNQFHQQRDGVSVYEEEPPWKYDSATETGGDDDEHIDKNKETVRRSETNQAQEQCVGLPISVIARRCADNNYSKGYDEPNYVSNRNIYHPEPYEERKFTPRSAQPFDNNCKTPWSDQNRGRFDNRNQFQRNNQYNNRRTEYSENNFSQGNNFRPRIWRNQNQGFDRNPSNRNFFRQSTPNTSRCGPQSGGSFQYSQGGQQSSYNRSNYYPDQPRKGSSSSLTSCGTQIQTNQEVLFTRRDKFDYKANVGDFDDDENKQQQSSQRNSCYGGRNTNFYQKNDFRNYESDVAKKLLPVANNENKFSWENNRACDFVPFNANEPVATSPPWSLHDSDTDCNPHINSLSRRSWLNNVINSKI